MIRTLYCSDPEGKLPLIERIVDTKKPATMTGLDANTIAALTYKPTLAEKLASIGVTIEELKTEILAK